MTTTQLDLLFDQPASIVRNAIPLFSVGDYAIVTEICHDGYYLWERCYVHEVLPDGYRVEICEGLVWGKPWYKDGAMITVSLNGLGYYSSESHYSTGAHWVPTVEEIQGMKREYETNSSLCEMGELD